MVPMLGFEGWAVESVVFVVYTWMGWAVYAWSRWLGYIYKGRNGVEVLEIGYYNALDVSIRHISILSTSVFRFLGVLHFTGTPSRGVFCIGHFVCMNNRFSFSASWQLAP